MRATSGGVDGAVWFAAARRLVAEQADGEELDATVSASMVDNSMVAFVLQRELDFYEQLGALDHVGAFDFELIDALIGNSLVARWELWRPTVDSMGTDAYPMFRKLADKMRRERAAAT